jgi:hypothetical protein
MLVRTEEQIYSSLELRTQRQKDSFVDWVVRLTNAAWRLNCDAEKRSPLVMGYWSALLLWAEEEAGSSELDRNQAAEHFLNLCWDGTTPPLDAAEVAVGIGVRLASPAQAGVQGVRH